MFSLLFESTISLNSQMPMPMLKLDGCVANAWEYGSHEVTC